MKKRIFAMLLAIVMLVGTIPMNAFATEATDPAVVLCETEGCEYASGHEGECSNYVAPTEACTTEGCTYGANHEGNCSNYVALTEACTTEGCTYGANHEGDCSNYVAPTEACATEGCIYGANHEGDCSNFVAPTECETEGCTLGYGHEGDCGTSSNEEADAETADQAAAQNVIDLITAIGEVTQESEAAIAAADAAYNNLTDAQKVLVTNLDVLETAKSTYSALTVPAPVEAAADAVVYVTVNNKGVLGKANDGSIMVNRSVTVTDINADGSLSYDEALVAAHAAYNSASGYVTEDYEESGKSVTKLWGVDNGYNYLFFTNGSPITKNVAESYVAAGNSLYISVLSEMTYGADWYTYFDKTNLTVKAGEEFTLTLKGYQGRSENPAAVAVSGASVGTWQSGSFSAIEGKSTDENAAVTLSFDEAGTYYVTASGTVSDTVYGMTVDCPTMAPVCVVKVEAAEDTTPMAPYFAELNVKMGVSSTSTFVNILEEGKFEYDLSIPANDQNMYVTAVLSEDAPEGSTVNATFINYKTGEETTIAITKADTHMTSALSNDITGTTVKITVGVDGDIQTYTLNVSRTIALGNATFKDAEGTSLTQFDGKYLVPENLESVIIKANSYGAALTINGQTAVSNEDYSFTPTWDENNECNVEVIATHNGETLSKSYVLKLYKEGDTLTGTCGDGVTWSLTGDVLTISGSGVMADYSTSSSKRPSWNPFVSNVKSVVVESGVTHIGNYTFYNTTTLESVTLAEGVKTVGQYAFNGCTALKSVKLPSTVESIGNFVFNGCTALSEITLPAGLTTLGNRVFQKCTALTSVEIPSTVTSVGTYVFNNCSALESATVKGAMGEEMFYKCAALKNITLTGATAIPESAFSNCTALETVVIPEGVTSVAAYAFGHCAALKSATVSGTVESLDALAFYNCPNLTNITINGDKFVQKDGLLYSADGTTLVMCLSAEGVVTVADGVTTINDSVFYNNTKITSVKLPESLTKIGASAFYGCTNLEQINVPNSVTQIGASAFRDCAKLTAVNIPEGITALENNVFTGCSGLTSVTLPSTLTSIGNAVFQKCTGLTSVVIPEGVTKLGTSAFSGCTALQSVSLPKTLTSLGMGCFGGCTALKSVEIPENVTSLPMTIFNGCTALETVVLPAALTSIGNSAFNNTTALTLVGFRGSPEQWAAVTGKGKPTVTVVYYYGRTDVASVTKHPEDILIGKGADATNALSVTSNPVDEGITISFTWYRNTENSTTGGTVVESTVSEDGLTSYCTPSTAEEGVSYYYCILSTVSNGTTYNIPSEIAKVDVRAYMWEGEGTQENPYLIGEPAGMTALYDYVASGENTAGLYFKMTADITLPVGWKSIGMLIDPSVGHINRGANMYAFSGTLDGSGYTVTVPEGGEPLLGYVKGATVKNLNIYGKQIAGYGLVNHLEGVGLSGEAICIDNVTLKSGSSTLKSGLIGTYITNNGFAGCSAAFYVTIKNCTIEEGVVIGYNKDQSMIGSIAGRIHGSIDNCVSYATVYGKDYVGGILGTRDNAMGGCVVTNSQFHGTVVATGTQVGGIVGGGYSNSTAPNGAKINIIDCSVSGSVTGADKVGGIVGSDSFVAQLWGGHTLKNNSFTGTVKATDGTYVGGIIGYYLSLNKYDDIAGNYYKAGCGADRGIGYVEYVDTSCETHETEIGATYFNTGDGTDECPTVAGCSWKKEHNRTDDPLGADAAKLCYTDSAPVTATELKVSGTYKTQYTTGEKLDLSGIILTVVYTDKSEETIDLSDVTVTGYDANKVGEQELTISYNGLTASITVTVKNPAGTITVTVSVYGDSKHGAGGTVHTLAGGGLTTWVNAKTYTVDSNSTVWDVLQKAFADNGITCNANASNSQGTVYISSLTRNGVTLSEFDNGTNSGWMYTLNGAHPENGVAQQYLKDGDKIIFHYTDDYTKEEGSSGNDDNKDAEAAEAVEKLIDAIGTVTLNSEDEIAAARKAYDALSYTQKQMVDNYATLTAAEATYAELKQADDEKKASAVEDLIDAIEEGSTTFEDDVKAAQKAYNNLTADQKKLVDNYYKLAGYLKDLADEEDKEAAEAVEKLIDAIGTVTVDSEEEIKAAREAYDKLTDEQKALVENLAVLEAAEEKLAQLKADAVTEDIYKTTGDYIENLGTPAPGSIGGEWMVIGLIRSDREVPGADDYYESVVKYVLENIDENERLHSAKSTDNSRIILALTAMGKDVTNVDGHNLLNGLNDMAFIQKQGINGPIWALIAFDSGNYPTPDGDVTREALIQVILDAQLADGGWALSGETADADMTGMAVQALAPYYESNADVKKALDEAIETMSKMQNADGSYGSIDGTSSESIAQIIVALAALGIDADKDERFIKNGISAVDALCAFYVEGGGFKHLMDGNRDGMATEQGYYALVAYFRNLDGKTGLYNMTDVIDMGGDVVTEEPVETEPVETTPAVTEPVEVDDEGHGFPWWIIIVILVAGVAIVVIVPVVKKKVGAK